MMGMLSRPPRAKQQLRAEMVQLREERTASYRDASRRAFQLISQLISPGEVVGIYWSIRNELPTKQLATTLLEAGFQVSFPRIENAKEISFRKADVSQLLPGIWGIMEPPGNAPTLVPSLAIVPGLAFSTAGSRLGWGNGYYDRYLAKHPEIKRVGFCFHFQLLGDVPTTKNDMTMDYIVTDQVAQKTTGVRT